MELSVSKNMCIYLAFQSNLCKANANVSDILLLRNPEQPFVNVLFQKISIPLPQKVFGMNPAPLWEFHLSSILAFKIFAFQDLPPPQNF